MHPLTRVVLSTPDRITADLLVVGLCEGDRPQDSSLTRSMSAAIAAELRRARWKGERNRVHLAKLLRRGSNLVPAR